MHDDRIGDVDGMWAWHHHPRSQLYGVGWYGLPGRRLLFVSVSVLERQVDRDMPHHDLLDLLDLRDLLDLLVAVAVRA